MTALVELRAGHLAIGFDDGTLRIWDAATGKCASTLLGCKADVTYLVGLRDGRLASAGCFDATVRIRDAAI